MQPITMTWSGFRGFRRATSIRLPRVTLLIGRNNVGKTSAYAPLLMLRQTLDARNPDTALLSRGGLVDVGPFRDYVSDHDLSREVSFTVTFPDARTVQFADGSKEAMVSGLEVGFKSTDGHTATLTRHRILDAAGKSIVTRSRDTSGEPFTVTAKSVLPTRVANGRPTRELTSLRTAMRAEQPEGFLIHGFGALMLPRSVREDPERWNKVQDWYNASFDLYDLHQAANESVRRLLLGISYSGPLRSLPLRTYRLAAESPANAGTNGEFAPEMLFRQRGTERAQLVDDWLGRLGYGSLVFDELSDEYFQVKLKRKTGSIANLADSGIGLSQVLPLLVQGATARANGTLIAQQPEIHLNPAQQLLATDFLIERSLDGLRIVIETHSEHVLLRLRRRIAEGQIEANDVAVYFVDNDDSETHIREVELGDGGEIARGDWPPGFFEEQLEDAFALTVAQSKRSHDR